MPQQHLGGWGMARAHSPVQRSPHLRRQVAVCLAVQQPLHHLHAACQVRKVIAWVFIIESKLSCACGRPSGRLRGWLPSRLSQQPGLHEDLVVADQEAGGQG